MLDEHRLCIALERIATALEMANAHDPLATLTAALDAPQGHAVALAPTIHRGNGTWRVATVVLPVTGYALSVYPAIDPAGVGMSFYLSGPDGTVQLTHP